MSEQTAPVKRRRGFVTFIKWFLILIIVLVVAVAGILATGMPQRYALIKFAGDALKSKIELGKMSLLGKVFISDFKAIPLEGGEPKIELENLEAVYKLNAPDKRNVESVTIDKLHLRQIEPAPVATPAAAAPAAAAKPEKPAAPERSRKKKGNQGGLDIAQELKNRTNPKNVNIKDLALTLEKAGIKLDIAGLAVDVKRTGGEEMAIQGDNVTGSLLMGEGIPERALNGKIDLNYKKAGKDMSVSPMLISLPGVAELQGTFSLNKKDKMAEALLELSTATFTDISIPASMAKGVPVSFKSLESGNSRLQIGYDGSGPSVITKGTNFNTKIQGLVLGTKDDTFFAGDATLQILGGDAAPMDLNLALTLNQAPPVSLAVTGVPLKFDGKLQTANWTMDSLKSVFPTLKPTLDSITAFNAITDTHVNVGFENMGLKLEAGMTLAVTDPVKIGAETATLTIASLKNTPVLKLVMGDSEAVQAQLALGAQKITAETAYSKIRDPQAKIKLESVDIPRWLNYFAGASIPETVSFIANGDTELKISRAKGTFEAPLNLQGGQLALGPLKLSDIAATGTLKGEKGTATFESTFESPMLKFAEVPTGGKISGNIAVTRAEGALKDLKLELTPEQGIVLTADALRALAELPSGGGLFAGLVERATSGQVTLQKVALALDAASGQLKATFTLAEGTAETAVAL